MEEKKTRERGREIGETGATVAANLKRIRSQSGDLSLRELETRLNELGVKISASGLQKIEAGTRRVDTDELMAIAIALNVSPNALLLPYDTSGNDVSSGVTAAPAGITGAQAWAWANGLDHLGPASPAGFPAPGPGRGAAIEEVKKYVDYSYPSLAVNFPTAGPDLLRLLMGAYHAGIALSEDEELSIWHVSSDGAATRVADLPGWKGDILQWMEATKKTVVAIAVNSADGAVARDEVMKALEDLSNGDD